jgi:hypothetical protein
MEITMPKKTAIKRTAGRQAALCIALATLDLLTARKAA